MHALIERYWGERIEELEAEHAKAPGEREAIYLTYDISAIDFVEGSGPESAGNQ